MNKNSIYLGFLNATKDRLDLLTFDVRFNELTMGVVSMQHSGDQSATVTAKFVVESETGKKHCVFSAYFMPYQDFYKVSCDLTLSSGERIVFNKEEMEMLIQDGIESLAISGVEV